MVEKETQRREREFEISWRWQVASGKWKVESCIIHERITMNKKRSSLTILPHAHLRRVHLSLTVYCPSAPTAVTVTWVFPLFTWGYNKLIII